MSDLSAVLTDAREWLAAQPTPSRGSATWTGFNNLRTFLALIEQDSSRRGLERACLGLGWHISDQYGAYDELPIIASFKERVKRIARAMPEDV